MLSPPWATRSGHQTAQGINPHSAAQPATKANAAASAPTTTLPGEKLGAHLAVQLAERLIALAEQIKHTGIACYRGYRSMTGNASSP